MMVREKRPASARRRASPIAELSALAPLLNICGLADPENSTIQPLPSTGRTEIVCIAGILKEDADLEGASGQHKAVPIRFGDNASVRASPPGLNEKGGPRRPPLDAYKIRR